MIHTSQIMELLERADQKQIRLIYFFVLHLLG